MTKFEIEGIEFTFTTEESTPPGDLLLAPDPKRVYEDFEEIALKIINDD